MTSIEMSIIDLQGRLWKDGKLVEGAPIFVTTSQLDPRLAVSTDGQLYDIESLQVISDKKFKSIAHRRLKNPNRYIVVGILDNGDLCVFDYIENKTINYNIRQASLTLMTSIIIYDDWYYIAYSDIDGWISIEITGDSELKIRKIRDGPNIDNVISVRDGMIVTNECIYSYNPGSSDPIFLHHIVTTNMIYTGWIYRSLHTHIGSIIVTHVIIISYNQRGNIQLCIDNRILENERLTEVAKDNQIMGLYRYKDTHIIVLADGQSYHISNFDGIINSTGIDNHILRAN